MVRVYIRAEINTTTLVVVALASRSEGAAAWRVSGPEVRIFLS